MYPYIFTGDATETIIYVVLLLLLLLLSLPWHHHRGNKCHRRESIVY